jgi:hypothetical protein
MPNVVIDGGFDRRVLNQNELPSAPAYLLFVGGNGKLIWLVATTLERGPELIAEARSYGWDYVIKLHPGKPTLNPRKQYYLCSEASKFGRNRRGAQGK